MTNVKEAFFIFEQRKISRHQEVIEADEMISVQLSGGQEISLVNQTCST